MLEAAKGVLDPPATVMALGKGLCGKGPGIEQRGHHQLHLAVWGNHADQAHRRRRRLAVVIRGTPGRSARAADHALAQARALKLADRLEPPFEFAADAEIDPPGSQDGDQPAPREAAVENQQISLLQPLDAVEQHLPLVTKRLVQPKIQKQFDPRQVQTTGHGVDDRADTLLDHRQAYPAAIRRADPPSAPARDPRCSWTRSISFASTSPKTWRYDFTVPWRWPPHESLPNHDGVPS